MIRVVLSALILGSLFARHASAEQDLLPSITVASSNIAVKLVEVATTTAIPTDLAVVPDGSGRMFMTMIGGDVRVVDGADNLLPVPFMSTASGDSFYSGDAQFTSLAFHPQFATVGAAGYGKLYTLEPEKANLGSYDFVPDFGGESHADVLYEYTVADPASNVFSGARREVLRARQPGSSHNFNDLEFDADGLLYIATGDGQNSGLERQNSQLLTNAFGKILRIDPLGLTGTPSANQAYSIPIDNPFHDADGPQQDEIWALGLRNPYRIQFDTATGDLWIGDVGQSDIESVDRIPAATAGLNFGWREKEGSYLFPSLQPDPDLDANGNGDTADANGWTDPVFEFDHQDGSSVTGGNVYRGTSIAELNGLHVFGDFWGNRDSDPVPELGRMFYGDPASGEVLEFLYDPAGHVLPERVFSIALDADGEILVLGGTATFSEGFVYRLTAGIHVPAGDLDQDGDVDLDDIHFFVAAYASDIALPTAPPEHVRADMDLDVDVDMYDFLLFNDAYKEFNGREASLSFSACEPATLFPLSIAVLVLACVGRRQVAYSGTVSYQHPDHPAVGEACPPDQGT